MSLISGRLARNLICGVICALGVFGLSVPDGEAQTGGRRGIGRGDRGRTMDPGALLPQLRNEEFLEELALTEEQREELDAIRGEFGQAMMFRGGTDDERKQRLNELDAKALEILSPDQKALWETRKAELIAKAKEEGTAPAGSTPGVAPSGAPPSAVPATPPADAKPTDAKPVETKPAVPRSARIETAPKGAVSKASFASKDMEAAGATGAEALLSFNFQYAPWTEVLELFAKSADLTLDLETTPTGTFSYRDSRSYSPTGALDVLNGYLLPRGFLLVRRDRFLVCLRIADGIPPNLAPQISVEELAERGNNELVSVVIPVRGLQVDQVIAEVRELLGPQGKASALKNTNSIVVTDLGSHVRRIHALLSAESAIDTRDTAFKSIPLKHISATEAERMIRRLFGLNSTTTIQAGPPQFNGQMPQQGGGGGGGRRGRGDRNRDGDEQPQDQNLGGGPPMPAPPVVANNAGGSQFANKIQVAADVRTNHLLVTASAALLTVVEDAVKTLDTNVDASGNEVRRIDVPVTLKTYTVPGGDISTISQTINQIIPGVLLGQDTRLGKLHIQATPDEHTEVARLIEELGGEGSSSVAVIHLQKMDALTLTNTLINLYSREGARAPTVEADPLGRRLIVRGTPDQILQVKTILAQLGEGGDAAAKTDRGNVRTLTLSGRDPEELLPLLKDSWTATRPNPIRIVVPSRPKPIRERLVPGAGADNRQPEVELPIRESAVSTQPVFRSAALETPVAEEDDAAPAAAEDESPAAEPAVVDAAEETATTDTAAPLSMEVIGDQLIISSPDTKALDKMEELYERLSGAIPPRTRWNVFYLRSADATEAAQMIERLFPQSNVTASTSSSGSGLLGSLAGGVSTIGRGLMNVSGLNQTLSASQSLRIVTDIRSNALFVAGPNDQVAEVEQILEVLDTTELPESLRDRVPRTIAIEHADVEEVAEVVESVFKDSMTPEGQMPGGRGGMNPLMMLMGGAAQQQGGRKQPSVQLTVGIDQKTNHLIVSCNDALFQQIETLVAGIDERAKQSRQTVRVVRLDQADPTLVQQTLGSLITKVSVGSTRRSRRPTNNPNSPAPGGNPQMPQPQGDQNRSGRGGAPGENQIRDAMIQQMMQQGGGEGFRGRGDGGAGGGRRGGMGGRGRGGGN